MLSGRIIWHRTQAKSVSIFGQRRGHEETREIDPTLSKLVVKVILSNLDRFYGYFVEDTQLYDSETSIYNCVTNISSRNRPKRCNAADVEQQ